MRSTKFSFSILLLVFTLISAAFVNESRAWNTRQQNSLGTSNQPWTWTGAGGNTNWNNGNNWCGAFLSGSCRGQTGGPPSTAIVIFDGTCQAYSNCNVTMPGGTISLRGITMKANYTGTIDQAATNVAYGVGGFSQHGGTYLSGTGTLTVLDPANDPRWIMTGGTFTGGSGDITLGYGSNGRFELSGGSFTSTSGKLRIACAYISFVGATFAHHDGTVEFEPTSVGTALYPSALATFKDVSFVGQAARRLALTPDTSSMYVAGNVYLNPSSSSSGIILNDGAIVMNQGNVIHTGSAVSGGVVFKFVGSSEQTLSSVGANDKTFPGIELAHPSLPGSLKFDGDIRIAGDFQTASSMGTYNLNGANITLAASFSGRVYNTTFILFPALRIESRADFGAFGVVRVDGDLTIAPTLSSANTGNGIGRIYLKGDLIFPTSATWAHAASVEFTGNVAQQVRFTSVARALPGMRFANTNGGVTFDAASVNFSSSVVRVTGSVVMPATAAFGYQTTSTIDMAGVPFTDVVFAKNAGFNIVGDMTVTQDVSFTNTSMYTMSGGRILVGRNFLNEAGALGYQGSTVIRLMGANPQWNFTAASDTKVPSIVIANTGTLVATGTPRIQQGNFTYESGNVDASAQTLTFDIGSGSDQTITPGTMEFGNVRFLGRHIYVTGAPMIMRGNLSIAANSSSFRNLTGALQVYGNVTVSGNGMSGTGTITLLGNSSTFSNTATAIPTGLISINKTAGQVVSLLSSLTLNNNQGLTISGGQLDLASSSNLLTLSGSGALTLSSGTSVKKSGSIITVGGNAVPNGAYGSGTILP